MQTKSYRPRSKCPYAACTHAAVPHDKIWEGTPPKVPQQRPHLPTPAARTASHQHCAPHPHATAAFRPPQQPLPTTRHRRPAHLPAAHATGSLPPPTAGRGGASGGSGGNRRGKPPGAGPAASGRGGGRARGRRPAAGAAPAPAPAGGVAAGGGSGGQRQGRRLDAGAATGGGARREGGQ